MKKGYKAMENDNNRKENKIPPHGGSSIMNSEEKQSKSIGEVIDSLLKDPKIMMLQCGKILNELKEEVEKLANKNKELEKSIIEKDKIILYMQGSIEGMEKKINNEIVINKLHENKITMKQARELLGLPRIESQNGRRRNGRR